VLVDRTSFQSGSGLGDTIPLIGLFAFAGQRLMPALQQLYKGLTQVRYGAAAVASLHANLRENAVGEELPTIPPKGLGLRRELRLDRVSYTYPNADGAGLSGISLSIQSGEKIGIVGSTGAGKTTFADLVLGLLVAQSGSLSVDGTPVTNENRRAWQQSVGYVPQDIFLTDANLAENIALGVVPAEIDQARVEHCARLAQLDGFINSELPHRYETTVGERGVRLSGGQRQRIGIARALYHDADLIVFDEATSALDNLTERDLMAAIETLPGDKTIMMIAHRLSTVRICDRILLLEKGRVAGFGSWDALVATNEKFRKLANISTAV
jgi:ABC-type multidrug transport system fused ATPase/permease subunit